MARRQKLEDALSVLENVRVAPHMATGTELKVDASVKTMGA